MKRVTQVLSFSIILFIIVLGSSFTVIGSFEERQPIATRITELRWSQKDMDPEYDFTYLYDNYTTFFFVLNYEIFNPNLYDVIYHQRSSTDAYVYTEITTTENHLFLVLSYLGWFIEGVDIYVQSGTTKKIETFHFIINEGNLTVLPDGVYSMGVYLGGWPGVDYSTSTLTMSEGEGTISYGDYTKQSIWVTLASASIALCLITIGIFVIDRRHKKSLSS